MARMAYMEKNSFDEVIEEKFYIGGFVPPKATGISARTKAPHFLCSCSKANISSKR